ncbi:MAG: UDP-2,4-diacetamido-2,4,6-trideoxy-beta-L-altropyranose hydrolase [Actinomycetota bacterium]|nr:UDP-2,4-diacetamido-2,4,6-trideoxy-beta-L-altropyranose hydrolase [Actinomycetota bacterium]
MRVVFRVDASTAIGSGHVMRCLALAESLRARGSDVGFVCRQQAGDLTGLITARGFDVHVLSAPGIQDADETLQCLVEPVDWMVVDHYGLGLPWEERIRSRAEQVLVMDDLAQQRHDCDILVDPMYPGDAERYNGLVPPSAALLLGPRYAQMDEAYAVHAHRPAIHHTPDRLLVFFGGSDLPDLTGRTLRAVTGSALGVLPVEVVVGQTNPHVRRLAELVSRRPGTTIHGPQPSLAALMSTCTVAAGAGGVTLWERMCMGLAGIVVSLADNQVPSCRALDEAGYVTYLGTSDDVTEAHLSAGIHGVLADPEGARNQAELGQALVDGLGALRVGETMQPTPTSGLVLRNARPADRGLLFGWANDPDVRRHSFSPEAITWAAHCAWFSNRLSEPRTRMFVMEAAGLPVGQARFDLDDSGAVLDYSVDEAFRGRGWGAALLSLACARLRSETALPIRAETQRDNAASIHALEHAGFRIHADADVRAGAVLLVLE